MHASSLYRSTDTFAPPSALYQPRCVGWVALDWVRYRTFSRDTLGQPSRGLELATLLLITQWLWFLVEFSNFDITDTDRRCG